MSFTVDGGPTPKYVQAAEPRPIGARFVTSNRYVNRVKFISDLTVTMCTYMVVILYSFECDYYGV